MYTRLGWTRVGVIPRYALYPDGSWCDTDYLLEAHIVGCGEEGRLPTGLQDSILPHGLLVAQRYGGVDFGCAHSGNRAGGQARHDQ